MKTLLQINLLCFLFSLFVVKAHAQTFELHKSDTINRTDAAGLKQGKWIVFNKNKQNADYAEGAMLEELSYKDGKKEGPRKQYYPNGKVKNEVTFKNNRPTGYSKFYYDNGNLSEEGNWVYGGWDGKYKNYYEEGNVSQDLSYAYGKKDGIQKSYHSNGKIKSEGIWKNGAPDGVMKEFNNQGVLVSEEKYVNGTLDEKESKYYVKVEDDHGDHSHGDTPAISGEQVSSEPTGVFDGNGYFKFKNKMGLIAREGTFSAGQLVDGNQYFYTDDGKLKKTLVYKEGKVIKTIEEK